MLGIKTGAGAVKKMYYPIHWMGAANLLNTENEIQHPNFYSYLIAYCLR